MTTQQPQYPPHPDNLPPAPGWPIHPALVTTGFELPGFEINRSVMVVHGVVVRSLGRLQGALVKSEDVLAMGSTERVAEMCEQAWQAALLKAMKTAAGAGANAITGLRYSTSDFSQGVTEVLVYGNAVVVEHT